MSQLTNLKVRYSEDWEGNRSTTLTYLDEQGAHRSTRINGHIHIESAVQSLRAHRQTITRTSRFQVIN